MYAHLLLSDFFLIYHILTGTDTKLFNTNGERINLATIIFFTMMSIDRVFIAMFSQKLKKFVNVLHSSVFIFCVTYRLLKQDQESNVPRLLIIFLTIFFVLFLIVYLVLYIQNDSPSKEETAAKNWHEKTKASENEKNEILNALEQAILIIEDENIFYHNNQFENMIGQTLQLSIDFDILNKKIFKLYEMQNDASFN